MGTYGTSRPPTERDTLHSLNGAPIFLGKLVSGGTTSPVDNSTTAVPFNAPTPIAGAPNTPTSLAGTLAGKMLLVQAVASGLVLPWTAPDTILSTPNVTIQTGTMPGVLLGAGERVIVLMTPTMGWLQWVSNSGSATAIVWELL